MYILEFNMLFTTWNSLFNDNYSLDKSESLSLNKKLNFYIRQLLEQTTKLKLNTRSKILLNYIW